MPTTVLMKCRRDRLRWCPCALVAISCCAISGCPFASQPTSKVVALGPNDVVKYSDRNTRTTYILGDAQKDALIAVLTRATDFNALPPGRGPVHPPFHVEYDLTITTESGELRIVNAVYPNCFRVDGALFISTRADYAALKAKLAPSVLSERTPDGTGLPATQ